MNIFVLDPCPVTSAEMMCDKHVVKMVLESAQILCSPFPPGDAPYRRTHFNHPCAIWARKTRGNYHWLVRHAFALSREYTYRYGREHASLRVIEWCHTNETRLLLEDLSMTPFPLAMPDQYRIPGDAVGSYRAYYLAEKASIATWTRRNPPTWWNAANVLHPH